MSADSALCTLWDLLKLPLIAIKRPIRYVMFSKSFADGLQEEVQNLENEVQRVNILAERARNNVREFLDVFATWEKKSDDALKEVRELLRNFENASKTCCYGTLPDPKCRYQFSRLAEGKIVVIRQLARKCKEFKELNDISFSYPTPGEVTAPTSARREGKDLVQSTIATASPSSASTSNELSEDGVFESRAAIIRDIMDALANNSNSVVGIHGLGGVGKSTLLADAERRIREEELFGLVAKADVSQNPDIKRIQSVIAHELGLDMKDYEYESMRANLLLKRLGNEKRKVLIILDNLWKGLNLKSVGIPCGHDNRVVGCKLLLTSRDRNVLRREMGCDKDFFLDKLEENEAKILFERMVGDKVHNDEFRPLVDEALRKCAGLPLLIVTMAKHFKDARSSEWRDALNQIEQCTNKGLSAIINTMLQLSYDHLETEDAKNLLQLCVAYGVSNPSVENLVRYGYGLGIFQKDCCMEEARARVSTLIHTLQASSFLLDNGGAGGFKIHDLVRDFIAQFILRDRPLLVLKNEDMLATHLQRERLESCMAICFPYIDMKELPKELNCPELRIFLLFNNNAFLEVQDSYFNSMRKLAVLDLTRISLTHSPTPFQFLENLHTLCLQSCSLEDVAILGELKGLQILSFVSSRIERLPKEIGQLVELRLLDLSYCLGLQIIEPGVLGRLIKLEELYMMSSFNRWNPVEQTQPTNASLIELNNMKNLCTLQVSIPDPSVLPKDLNVKKLTKYRIRIGNGWYQSEYEGSRTLELKLTPTSDVIQKGCVQSILSKTDNLLLEELNETEQSVCALSQQGFPELKHLQVHNSSSVHYIHISSSKSFSTLKVIRVERCDKMKVLFPLSLLKGLPQLEEIKVVGCKLMCGIVEADDCDKVELRNLHVLALCDLPNINNFFTAGTTPSSSTLDNQVGTQIAFFNGQQVAFQRLETLEIIGLDNLEFLFSPSMVKSFTQLKELTVSSCKKMEVIIMDEEALGMETSEILAFPMLTDLYLEQLQSLMCFSRGKCAQESRSQNRVGSCATTLFNQEVAFPNLENLYIEGMENVGMMWDDQIAVDSFSKLKLLSVNECKKLVNVVPPFILGRLKSLETLEVGACESLEVVFKLQPPNPLDGHHVARSSLKKMGLYDLPKLKHVWDKEIHRQVKFQCLRWVSLRGCARLTSLFSASIARDLIQLEELKINRCGIVELIGKERPTNEPSIDVNIEGPNQVASSFPSYFQRMKTVDVSHCHGLSNMFTPTIAKHLVEITKLRISKCDILTEVISDEGGNEGHVVAFNQLKYMELDGLTQLRCFSSGGYTLMLPLLEDIMANRCPKMMFFSKGLVKAPKLKRVQVGLKARYEAIEYPYFWKGNVNMTIQNIFQEMATFAGTKFMRLFEFPELIGKWHSKLNPITSSWQLKSLVVDKCPSFINAIPFSLMLNLDKMTRLQVHNCEHLEEIFDFEGLEGVDCTQVLPQLQCLCLVNLPKLRQLWNRDLQGTMCFNSLQHLGLYKCSNLRHAFVPSMAQCLPNLYDMEIKECEQMEGVIVDEEGLGSAVEEITFPNLKSINLECLPNLTSFLSWKNHTLECPILSKLSIAHCPKMRSLTWQSSMEIDNGTPSLFTPQVQFPQLKSMFISHVDNLSKIWTDNPLETLKFKYLQKLEARNCKSLENLFPHWVATSLTQLEELQVESCVIEEIVASGDDMPHSNTTQVLFPQLSSLVLHDMPRLKSFCPNLPTLNWPLLKDLRVTHCDKVNMLSFAAFMNNRTQRNDQQELSNQEAHSLLEKDFPMLERLSLVDKNIPMIQDGKFPEDIFDKAKALTLACFHDEKAAFPPIFLPEKFQNLQSLEILCSSFEEIFSDEGLVDEGKRPVLANLRKLKLNKLPNLKRVWREDSLVSKILRSIKAFEVWDCPCLTTIFPAMTSFQNLTYLEVKNSSGLVHLVTASVVTNLVHLQWMTIIGCERMKEVVGNDGNEEGKVISFGKLHFLTLQNLPSLECFSSATSCSFKFPSLWRIEVEECLKMKIFTRGTLSTPQLDDVTLFGYKWEERDWREMGDDLNTTIQKLSA